MKRITIILLFLNICLKCIYSENLALERLSSFVTNINTFNNLNPQEKVYVHFLKITDKTGTEVSSKGKVVSGKVDILSTFITVHDGMGFFEITPSSEKYSVIIGEYNNKYRPVYNLGLN